MKYFISTDEQLKNVKKWNKKYKWGFTAADFKKLPKAPEWPSGDLSCVVLVPYLKTIQSSFDGLCHVIKDEYENYWQWDGLKEVRLLNDIKEPVGIRWEVIDLGANQGKAPKDVRGTESAHIGVLAATAHFKDWVQAMDGDKVPYVGMPGLEATVPGGEPWARCPDLCWNRGDREVLLGADWAGRVYGFWAAPVVREPQFSETKNSAALGSLELPEVLEINGQTYRKEK